MKVIPVTQGSSEWLAMRAQHFCGSDAPAAMGVSKFKSRSDLLREKATGYTQDVSPAKQRLFDAGHASENAARVLVEDFLQEELFPCVGTLEVDGLHLLASLDGATMGGDIIWESKQHNADLADQVARGDLEPHYWAQLEHGLLVSGADRAYFTCTDGTRERMAGMWYESVPERRAQVIAAWKQFSVDLAAWKPGPAPVEKIIAEPVEALPAPVIQVTGQLALQDNFKVFEDRLRDFLANRLIREPKTDEDFVNLDAQIKAMKAGREALKSAKAQMLAQVQPVDQAGKTADMLDSLLQQNCKLAEDLLKNEKERRRGEIVTAGTQALADHIAALNKRIGRPYMPPFLGDFGSCVKGLKSLSSMEDKVSTHLATVKIAANEVADRIQINLATMRELAADHVTLFPDTAQLVLKGNDDLTALVKTRIAEHVAAEQRRADALAEQARERIAAEERAKAEKALRAEQDAAAQLKWEEEDRQRQADQEARDAIAKAAVPAPEPAPVIVAQAKFDKPTATDPPSMALGHISTRLGFTVTAAFLRQLGFEPAAQVKAAMLYHESEFPRICRALVRHIESVVETAPA